jgi:hypothetical protein
MPPVAKLPVMAHNSNEGRKCEVTISGSHRMKTKRTGREVLSSIANTSKIPPIATWQNRQQNGVFLLTMFFSHVSYGQPDPSQLATLHTRFVSGPLSF